MGRLICTALSCTRTRFVSIFSCSWYKRNPWSPYMLTRIYNGFHLWMFSVWYKTENRKVRLILCSSKAVVCRPPYVGYMGLILCNSVGDLHCRKSRWDRILSECVCSVVNVIPPVHHTQLRVAPIGMAASWIRVLQNKALLVRKSEIFENKGMKSREEKKIRKACLVILFSFRRPSGNIPETKRAVKLSVSM